VHFFAYHSFNPGITKVDAGSEMII